MILYRGGTFGCAVQLHGHAYRGPVYINASADSPVRTALQRHGRLASALEVDSRVRAGLQRGGQLARPHRFTKPQPTHLSTSVADSLVIGFNFTIVIINSAADKFWLNISGEIHPVYFYIIYCFLQKSNYSGL